MSSESGISGDNIPLAPVEDEHKFDPAKYLERPELYGGILRLASKDFKIVVMMVGPCSSGKTTVAQQLLEDLKHIGKSASRHCSDDGFIDAQGAYNFDPKRIHAVNRDNQEAFVASKALVRIVDNTNTTFRERRPYLEDRSSDGAVHILLKTIDTDIETLMSRDTKGIPRNIYERYSNRMLTGNWAPSYYGVFFTREAIEGILERIGVQLPEKNSVPPYHLTYCIAGSRERDRYDSYRAQLGREYRVKVVGVHRRYRSHCGAR